jgi:hypothetical protein
MEIYIQYSQSKTIFRAKMAATLHIPAYLQCCLTAAVAGNIIFD